MKANLCLFLFFFLLCTGCGKDEPEIEPGPDGPDTPVENTSTYVPIDWDKAGTLSVYVKTLFPAFRREVRRTFPRRPSSLP